eukprot:g17760.t1
MGTHMGPSCACLFVDYVKQSPFSMYTGTVPQLFRRYIDNCIGAASYTQDGLEQFIDFANNFHPALKFTWFISGTSFPFLDLSISVSGDSLWTDIYYKPTDSHSYLDYTFSHPVSCKISIPFSQFLRLRRICSDEETPKHPGCPSFPNNGLFPHSVIQTALLRASSIPHSTALN